MFNIIFSLCVCVCNICSGENLRKAAKLLPEVMKFGYFFFIYILFSMCQKEFCALENSNSRKLIGHTLKVLQGAHRRLSRMIYFKSTNSQKVFFAPLQIFSQILHNNKIHLPKAQDIFYISIFDFDENGLCQWVQLEFCQLSCCPFRSCLSSDLHRTGIFIII